MWTSLQILSIQELDDVLLERFKDLPVGTSSLIDFVEDAFDEIRRSLFNIEEIVDDGYFEGFFPPNFPREPKEPAVHFSDDPDYCMFKLFPQPLTLSNPITL